MAGMERFTQRARRVLSLAHQEAERTRRFDYDRPIEGMRALDRSVDAVDRNRIRACDKQCVAIGACVERGLQLVDRAGLDQCLQRSPQPEMVALHADQFTALRKFLHQAADLQARDERRAPRLDHGTHCERRILEHRFGKLQRFAQVLARFGEAPFPHYTFVLMLGDNIYGGEEPRDYYTKFGETIRTLMQELMLTPNPLGPALVTADEIEEMEALTHEIELLMSEPEGWLVYNTHGLDDEGWGPVRADYLERLLDRLMAAIGLHGRAFVPLLSGFACAVPAIMATRLARATVRRVPSSPVARMVFRWPGPQASRKARTSS